MPKSVNKSDKGDQLSATLTYLAINLVTNSAKIYFAKFSFG